MLGLGRGRFDLAREVAQDQTIEIDFVAGVVDVNADEVALTVVIQDDAIGYLSGFDTRLFGQIDVEGIRVCEVLKSHGRNPLSGKAL